MSDVINFYVGIDKKKAIRNIILIVAIIVVLSVAYFLHCSEPNLKYSELVKIATGGFVLIGLIYSIMTYELAQKKNQHDMRMQKISATYNACSEWYSLTMMEHSRRLTEFQTGSYSHLIKGNMVVLNAFFDDEKNSDLKTSYKCVFNYFESLAIASNESLMDEEFIRKYFSGVFKRYYNDFIPLIENRRISKKDQDILIGFTTLVEKWKTIK